MKATVAKERILEAAAKARDVALVQIGKEAEARQVKRAAKERRRGAGKMALAAVAAGAAIAAGTMALRARAKKEK